MKALESGPWEAVGSCVRTARTETGGGIFVADCWRKWQEPVEFAFDGTEADAIAAGIAAAPEMYEAIKAALCDDPDWRRLCVDALAKAEGRTK